MVGTRSAARREQKPQDGPPPTIDKKSEASRKQTIKSSAKSSAKARRAQLVLEAAQKKALLQMDLIDKKLAVDLAELNSNGSQSLADDEPGEEEHASRIEEWVKTQRVTSGNDDALFRAQRQDVDLQQMDNAGPLPPLSENATQPERR
uniref:Uncharacterized protein n=1 Tax=Heliothis virescens TaxID=7102 RepID=A0A2A4JWW8_HELVI